MKSDDKVECRTPTPGKKPTRIDRSKFETMRRAILRVTPRKDGVLFSELPGLVEGELTPKQLDGIGSLMWYLTTVKLELEVRGEIERVPGSGPQRLVRSAKRAQA